MIITTTNWQGGLYVTMREGCKPRAKDPHLCLLYCVVSGEINLSAVAQHAVDDRHDTLDGSYSGRRPLPFPPEMYFGGLAHIHCMIVGSCVVYVHIHCMVVDFSYQ